MTQPTARVWIVTSGEDSDYRINYVFATKELADEFIAREITVSRYTDYEVEEWDLLTAVPPKVAVHRAYAMLMPDGSLTNFHLTVDLYDETPVVVAGLEAPASEHSNSYADAIGRVRLSVNYCRSAEDAQKALYDLAARVKAEREGIA